MSQVLRSVAGGKITVEDEQVEFWLSVGYKAEPGPEPEKKAPRAKKSKESDK